MNGSRSPVIETRKGTRLQFVEPRLMTPEEWTKAEPRFEHVRRALRFPGQLQQRRPPTLDYNCHGLTFASRRDWLADDASIAAVLEDDGDTEIRLDAARPGDVIVYRYPDGAVEHTGIIYRIDAGPPRVPWVLSKWGFWGEYLHRYDNCPYAGGWAVMREGQK